MLRHRPYGPVDYFAMARSWGGRHILTTGVYVVDGLLIDTGPPNAPNEIRQILGQADVNACVITHHHEDHVGNADLVPIPAKAIARSGVKRSVIPVENDHAHRSEATSRLSPVECGCRDGSRRGCGACAAARSAVQGAVVNARRFPRARQDPQPWGGDRARGRSAATRIIG